ncbi:hypothetical protein ACVMB3_007073 [Sinorhizobium meliloti]
MTKSDRLKPTLQTADTLILDIRSFEGSPQPEYGGAYHISVPDLGRDLKSMGFNLVSRANNHSPHWGVEGMRETRRLLDENGITHAGVGENLSQAAAARFVETAKGRVALVSFATTFMPVSGLRFCGRGTRSTRCERASFDANITLPTDALERLRRVRNVLPGYESPERDPGRIVLLGEAFVAGDKPTSASSRITVTSPTGVSWFARNRQTSSNLLREKRSMPERTHTLHTDRTCREV